MSDEMITVSKGQLAQTIGEVVEEKTAEMRRDLGVVNKAVFSRSDEDSLESKKKVGKFFKAVLRGDIVEAKGLSEGSSGDGGYLVHSEFEAGVVRAMERYGVARKYCSLYNMTSKELEVTTLATNVTTYWVAEGAQITASSPTFARKTITPQKLAALIPATNELLEDADHNVFETIVNIVGEQFARAEDIAVLTGSGTTFTGILEDTSANIVTMAATNTSFNDMTADDLNDVMRAVPVKYKKGYEPRWYMDQSVLAIVEKLKDDNGEYIYRRPGDGEAGFLWGYPIELTDVMPDISDTAADTKFVAFGDLKFIGFGRRKGISTKILSEGTVGTTNLGEEDESAIRVVERVGFQILDSNAFGVLKTAAS